MFGNQKEALKERVVLLTQIEKELIRISAIFSTEHHCIVGFKDRDGNFAVSGEEFTEFLSEYGRMITDGEVKQTDDWLEELFNSCDLVYSAVDGKECNQLVSMEMNKAERKKIYGFLEIKRARLKS